MELQQQPQRILLPAKVSFIVLTLALALLFNLLPWRNIAGVPDLTAAVLAFWCIHQPRRVGIGIAFGGLVGTSFAGEFVAFVVIGTFIIDLIVPALELPGWMREIALTAHLGQPMLGTWDWAGIAACVVLAAGGLLVGAWGMARRDVAR